MSTGVNVMNNYQKGDIVRLRYGSERIMIVQDSSFYTDCCFCDWTDNEGKHRAIISNTDIELVERKKQ